MARQLWTRDELIVTFNLYCKLPFGKYHRGNRQVIELAQLLGRTPSAVAMKLCNFASHDPTHQRRGVGGLKNSSRSDELIWNEFNANWDALAVESEQSLENMKCAASDAVASATALPILEELVPDAATEAQRLMTVRLLQRFFRLTILAGYGTRCCVCSLNCGSLLVASHIVPWAVRPELRVNPRNGLCLCAIHDKAFDRGLITVSDTFTVRLSESIRRCLPSRVIDSVFTVYHDVPIQLPEKFRPDPEFLRYHNENVFSA